MSATFSLNEVGFLTGQSIAAINRAIDDGTDGSHEKHRARRFDLSDLRAIAVIGEIGEDPTPIIRRKISAALRLRADGTRVEIGLFGLDFNELERRITERLLRLETLRQLVEPQDDGDPLIRGTRSSVYVVAAFTRGQTVAEIIEDCPGLTPELIEAAVDYSDVYPRAGPPLPTRSFKRMLSDLATSGVWDVETDDEPLFP